MNLHLQFYLVKSGSFWDCSIQEYSRFSFLFSKVMSHFGFRCLRSIVLRELLLHTPGYTAVGERCIEPRACPGDEGKKMFMCSVNIYTSIRSYHLHLLPEGPTEPLI